MHESSDPPVTLAALVAAASGAVPAQAGRLVDKQVQATLRKVVQGCLWHGAAPLDLLRLIRQEDPHIPVIIITGNAGKGVGTRALQWGAAAFLSKPFDEQQLLDEVRRALRLTSSHD